LGKIRQPTLILWGDNDKILGIKDAPKLQSALPISQLLWIKNCGHVPHLEQPQITASRILSF
ncbi:alpha/beta fold hydrolase, partial [Richelia intracellularis]|uniref:alpha/beta fold hydrolase n=1 Tax=Richelia intracellularis TaxID=1164990 RepID=UPI0005C79FE1